MRYRVTAVVVLVALVVAPLVATAAPAVGRVSPYTTVADGTRFHESGNAAEYISWYGASLPLSSSDARAYSAEGNKAVATVAPGYVTAHPASDFPAHHAFRVVGSLSEFVFDGEEILPLRPEDAANCIATLGQSSLAVVPDLWVRSLTIGPDTACSKSQSMGPFSLVQTYTPPSSELLFGGFSSSTLVGDFNGDGKADKLIYGPTSDPDAIWYGTDNGFKLGPAISVNGFYQPAVGDFNGDGRADVLWYADAGSGFTSSIWYGRPGNAGFLHGPAIPTPPASVFRVEPGRRPDIVEYSPRVGDFNGDGKADVYWYVSLTTRPSLPPNELWFGATTGFTVGPKSTSPVPPFTIPFPPFLTARRRFASVQQGSTGSVIFIGGGPPLANQSPIVGDFNGDGKDDLLWYAPGTARLWDAAGGTFVNATIPNVYGRYEPVVGDFNGDGNSDVLWYAPGSAADSLWRGSSNGFTNGPAVAIDGDYQPVVGDFNGDGKSDVYWSSHGSLSHTWFGAAGGFTHGPDTTEPTMSEESTEIPSVGDFNGDGHDDILWWVDTIVDTTTVFTDVQTLVLWHAH